MSGLDNPFNVIFSRLMKRKDKIAVGVTEKPKGVASNSGATE